METFLLHDEEHPSATLKAEPNVLRLPIFALRNKNLQKINGYRYAGTLTRSGRTYNFTFEVARSTMAPYPGLTARKAHQAILSILSERGFPLENPMTWTWRDLFRRMNISPGGRTEQETKAAIESIALLGLRSSQAIWSESNHRPISTKGQVLHLYDRVVFTKDRLPDGTIADTNHLWLGQWYLDNLNANYFTYLDYDLWQHLDHQSPIASRLYELSLSKFSKAALLRINYPTFAQLLPLQPQKKYSDAHRQLSRAFDIVTKERIYETPRWYRRQSPTIAQLELRPGNRLLDFKNASQSYGLIPEETIDNITVKELHVKPQLPEGEIVSDFYNCWQKTQQRGRSETVTEFRSPTAKELKQIQGYIAKYGIRKTKALMPIVIKLLAENWPRARTFAAVDRYITEAAAEYDDRQLREKQVRRQAVQNKREREASAKERAELQQLERDFGHAFNNLSQPERDRLIETVMTRDHPNAIGSPIEKTIRQSDDVRKRCLRELAHSPTPAP